MEHEEQRSINLTNNICLGDKLTISPIFGRKRTIALNRTKYEIIFTKSDRLEIVNNNIKIPSIDSEEKVFQLELLSKTEDSDEDVYSIRAIDNERFTANGVATHFAVVQGGIDFRFGFNKLCFSKEKTDDRKNVSDLIPSRVAQSQLPILILGQTGVGKTRLAKIIHEESRVQGRFVHLNISSFSKGLVESELFGHIKGAFTGANNEKMGAFSEANNGTIFIDEIDSLSLELQVKLLLFFDNKTYRKVGGSYDVHTNARLIFSSGRNLRDLVQKEKMRLDFFHRITSGYEIKIPNLENSPKQLSQAIDNCFFKMGKIPSKRLKLFYLNYSWPGNYRQLNGHIEKKCLLTAGNLVDLDEEENKLGGDFLHCSSGVESNWLSMEELKINYVKRVFLAFNKNVSNSAKVLKITPNTVRSLIKRDEIVSLR